MPIEESFLVRYLTDFQKSLVLGSGSERTVSCHTKVVKQLCFEHACTETDAWGCQNV